MSEHPMTDPLEASTTEPAFSAEPAAVNTTPVARAPKGRGRGKRVLAVVAGVAMVPALYAAASAVTGGGERPTVSAASGADDTATSAPGTSPGTEVETEHGVTIVKPDDSPTPTTPTTPEREVENEPSTTVPTTVPDDSSPPPTEAPAPVTQTVNSTGGSITVTLDNGVLSLDNVSAAAGFTPQVHDNDGERVEVRFFDAQGKEWRIRIEVAGDSMTQEITFHG